MAPPAAVPFTWVDHRRSVPTTEELENRRNLLGYVRVVSRVSCVVSCAVMCRFPRALY
jgi:hypothetical protein